jgi:hypothetical protein
MPRSMAGVLAPGPFATAVFKDKDEGRISPGKRIFNGPETEI